MTARRDLDLSRAKDIGDDILDSYCIPSRYEDFEILAISERQCREGLGDAIRLLRAVSAGYNVEQSVWDEVAEAIGHRSVSEPE